jgi:dethiobiotin synthetase
MGVPVSGLKPIETGIGSSPIEASDSFQLSAASFGLHAPAVHPLYSFADPLTPARAARHAGTVIQLDAVRSWVEAIATDAPAGAELIIESAGGVFSPLGDGITNFELARALEPATWVLVAPDRLGVLHDVVSCWLAMSALGRPPDCIVLSAPEHADPSTGTNCEELARNPKMPPILSLPRGDTAPLRSLATRPRP